ncbi:MAG: ATP-binding protein [Alphaproteobacteria bacterium]
MPSSQPTLHMFCGKAAAGKSTLAASLACAADTVLVSEDTWLAALYSDQMTTLSDYVRCAKKLRAVMGPHVSSLLNTGISVVLDFPANTIETRNWMRGILEGTGAGHQLHVLNASDEVCLARLQSRNAKGEHAFSVTEEQFRQLVRHYTPPSPDEGFNLVMHDVAE